MISREILTIILILDNISHYYENLIANSKKIKPHCIGVLVAQIDRPPMCPKRGDAMHLRVQ